MKFSFNLKHVAQTVAVIAVLSAPAAANTLTYQGVTFETFALNANTLQLSIFNANAATGDWAGINYLRAFEIKGIDSAGGGTIISGPTSWGVSSSELNANGCAGGGSGGSCFSGTPTLLTSSMIWNIQFTGSGLDFSNPNLKVNFLTNSFDGKKTGSNLSMTIAVPEPETYAMMLAGLAIMGFVSMRRRRHDSSDA